MNLHFESRTKTDKETRYREFITQYAALIDGELDETAVMANTAAALKEAFGFFLVGFYLAKSEEELTLGPFQGNVACYRIKKGRGVCGTAWQKARPIIVPDVDLFPGHIACSSASRSEIVIPVIHNNIIRGVLDIDSDQINSFDDTDCEGLKQIVDIMVTSLYQ